MTTLPKLSTTERTALLLSSLALAVLLRFAASLRRLRCQLQHSCQAQERIKQLFARTG